MKELKMDTNGTLTYGGRAVSAKPIGTPRICPDMGPIMEDDFGYIGRSGPKGADAYVVGIGDRGSMHKEGKDYVAVQFYKLS